MSIDKIAIGLSERFSQYDWDIDIIESNQMYCIMVNDFDFYKASEYLKLLREKIPKE